MTSKPQIDQKAIADNIDDTVKRTALRKVRKLVDKLENEETAKRRLESRALIIVGVAFFAVAAWFTYSMVASDVKFERGQSIQLPVQVTVPAKR